MLAYGANQLDGVKCAKHNNSAFVIVVVKCGHTYIVYIHPCNKKPNGQHASSCPCSAQKKELALVVLMK